MNSTWKRDRTRRVYLSHDGPQYLIHSFSLIESIYHDKLNLNFESIFVRYRILNSIRFHQVLDKFHQIGL